jgi:cytochrome c
MKFLLALSCLATMSVCLMPSAYALSADEAKKVMQKSGCIACHDMQKDKIGPSYESVSERYTKMEEETKKYLAGKSPKDHIIEKVRKGSAKSKNWTKSKEGKAFGVMTPTPAGRISDADLGALVDYILALKK